MTTTIKKTTFTKAYPGKEALTTFFKQHGVTQVECMFGDLIGFPRGKLMPASSFAAQYEARVAEAIIMQAVTGEYSDHPVFPNMDPDVRLVPDYSTLKIVPWSSVPRAMVIHDCEKLNGKPCTFAPRVVLKQVLERYKAKGLTPVVAPEIEFYLTAPNINPDLPLVSPVARSGRPEFGQSAYGLNMLNELAPFWDEFRGALDTLGVVTDTWLHESGQSQYEINLLHGDALDVTDQAFLFKYTAKEIAIKHGMNAIFMAKPISGRAGSSMHTHQSIVDGTGQNIFSNADGSQSDRFRHFIGGLQAYMPDMMLIYAPYVNSYRRFVEHSQAPVNLQWGIDNRTAGLRVPISDPSARRVENRIAGADANPYLVVAATLAAGLAGMEERLMPTEPIVGSGYAHGHDLARGYQASLSQMAGSGSCRRLLGEDFVTGFLAVKELEYRHYLHEISAWERRMIAPQV